MINSNTRKILSFAIEDEDDKNKLISSFSKKIIRQFKRKCIKIKKSKNEKSKQRKINK